MKFVKIELTGDAKQALFSLELEPELQSARDWLVVVSAFWRDSRIATADLDWHYSLQADSNFAYLAKDAGQKVVNFPLLNSAHPFDALEIRLFPWSKPAKQSPNSPRIISCTFSIANHRLSGGAAVATVGTVGIIRNDTKFA